MLQSETLTLLWIYLHQNHHNYHQTHHHHLSSIDFSSLAGLFNFLTGYFLFNIILVSLVIICIAIIVERKVIEATLSFSQLDVVTVLGLVKTLENRASYDPR